MAALRVMGIGLPVMVSPLNSQPRTKKVLVEAVERIQQRGIRVIEPRLWPSVYVAQEMWVA